MAVPIVDQRISPYGAGDVLQVLLAQIGKLKSELAENLIVGGGRDADASRFSDAVWPCCDIDAITKDVVTFA